MRIIAGVYGGRRLVAPRGLDTRPTADRVKEAVFNILGPPAHDPARRFRVLDLFAGSGALGLESLSRGADEVVLVDSDRAAIAAAERNVATLGVTGRVRLLQKEAGVALRSVGGRFDWIFLDPPYAAGASLDRALRLLGDGALLAEGGVVVAEHDTRGAPGDRYGTLALADRRAYGQTAVSFFRVAPAAADAPGDGAGGKAA